MHYFPLNYTDEQEINQPILKSSMSENTQSNKLTENYPRTVDGDSAKQQ